MPDHALIETPKDNRPIAIFFLIAACVINLWLVSRHWNESLLDAHEFRQVQTAITAHFIKKEGITLAYETPLLGPPWSIPMEFPTYQIGVAWLSKFTGLPLEQSGRLLSILSLYASLPAIWLLLTRWRMTTIIRCSVLAMVLTCPILIFYSRTFMIESMALALCLWFLWGFWRTVEDKAIATLPLVCILGTLAALTKITTFAVFCIPASVLSLVKILEFGPSRWRIRSMSTAAIALIGLSVPILAGVAWVHYSDHQKSLNPYAEFLTSAKLQEWNWGTIAQRLNPEFWKTIYLMTSKNVVSEPVLLVLIGLLPALGPAMRWRVAICIPLYFSGCLLFTNLYFVHDYYSYATAAFLAASAGMVIGALLDEKRVPRPAAITIFALMLIAQNITFTRGYGTFYTRPNAPIPPFAEIIRRTTAESDVLVAYGLDWNGVIPYHAQRRALMVPHHRLDDRDAFNQSLAGLKTHPVGALIIAGELRESAEFVLSKLHAHGMETFPIASTNEMDLYLRPDLHERARGELIGNHYPGVVFQLERKAARLAPVPETSLDAPTWEGKFTMMSPAPFAYRSPFHPLLITQDGQPVISTHAPMEFLFHPPHGATQVQAVGSLVPNAYSQGNTTDGVILQIWEEFPDGRRQLVAERELKPITRPEDRTEISLQYTSPQPFKGVIVLRIDPGPMGNINCDWGYWRNVKIF